MWLGYLVCIGKRVERRSERNGRHIYRERDGKNRRKGWGGEREKRREERRRVERRRAEV